jgi:serine/threonine-protein kinase
VPNVLGLDDGTARSQIENAGLVVGAVRMTANCTVGAGGVLTQNPAGGSQVARGSTVTLSESTGRKSNGQPCVVN